MSKKYEKFLAKQELSRRRLEALNDEMQRIKSMSNEELEKIVNEPNEPEEQ